MELRFSRFIHCCILHTGSLWVFFGRIATGYRSFEACAWYSIGAILCYPSLYIFACLSGADVAPSKVLSFWLEGLLCALYCWSVFAC